MTDALRANPFQPTFFPLSLPFQTRNVSPPKETPPTKAAENSKRITREIAPPPPKKSCKCLNDVKGFLLHPHNTSWLNAFAGESRAVHSLLKEYFQNLSRQSKILAATQFTHSLALPFHLHSLAMASFDLFADKGVQPKIDAALSIIGALSDAGDSISTIVTALADIGALSQSVLTWAGPMNIASNLLSVVFIIMSSRSLYFNGKILKELNAKLDKTDGPDYRGAYEVLRKHKYSLPAHCGIDRLAVCRKIKEIYTSKHHSPEPRKVRESLFKERIDRVFKAVKTKIHCNFFSDSLSITITKVGILATLLFAFSPFFAPLALVGAAFLAFMFACIILRLSFNYFSSARYKKSIKLIPSS